jgi:hypothetical protein
MLAVDIIDLSSRRKTEQLHIVNLFDELVDRSISMQ